MIRSAGEKAQMRQKHKESRTVAIVNGMMLVIASPLLIVIGAAVGAETSVWTAAYGVVPGLILLVAGVIGITWARREGRDKN